MINLAQKSTPISYDPSNYINIYQKTSIPFEKLFYLNIEQFEFLNKITGNSEASLLFSKLRFFWQKYAVLHNGEKIIITNIKKISSWFGFFYKKTSSLLSILEKAGLISVKLGLSQGIKSLFIGISKKINFVPLNHKLFDLLHSYTGTMSSLVLLRIFYGFMNTKIEKAGKRWVSITHKELAKFAMVSTKTIERYIGKISDSNNISKLDFVSINVFRREGIPKSHFHLSENFIKKIKEHIAENGWIEGGLPVDNYSEHDQNLNKNAEMSTSETDKRAVSETDKRAESYIEEINTENNIINNSSNVSVFPTPVKKEKIRDISFDEQNEREPESEVVTNSNIVNINNYIQCSGLFPIIRVNSSDEDINFSAKQLNPTQYTIVKKAFEGLTKGGLRFSNPREILEQMKFSIVNEEQHSGVLGFTHRLNRILKLLAAKIWATPKGFSNHCEYGIEQKKKRDLAEKSWEESKRSEYHMPMASNECTKSNQSLNTGYKPNVASVDLSLPFPNMCLSSLNSEAKTGQIFYVSSIPDNQPMSEEKKHEGLKQVRNLKDILRRNR